MHKYGEVKRLKLWWQLNVISLPSGTYNISGHLVFVEQSVQCRMIMLRGNESLFMCGASLFLASITTCKLMDVWLTLDRGPHFTICCCTGDISMFFLTVIIFILVWFCIFNILIWIHITDQFGFKIIIMKFSPESHGTYITQISQTINSWHCVTNNEKLWHW
jgi:hypothetical protein